MGTEWGFFDTFDDIVYVADIERHEIVYVNNKARLLYGIQPEDLKRGHCYNLLQNNAVPCTFCNNDKLQEGRFIKWNYYNPILKKNLFLQSTLVIRNGRKYRMEFASVLDEQGEAESANAPLENMEKLVNDAIATAIQQPMPDESIASLLEAIGRILKGDRVYIFEKNEYGNMDNTYEWVAAGINPEKENLQNVASETFEVWNKCFQKDHMVVIKDAKLTAVTDPLVYAYLKPQCVNSFVVVPFSLHIETEALCTEMDIDGFFGIDNPPVENLEHTKILLRIVVHFILGSLKRRNLIRELQCMSLTDQQTKLGNRYAMNQYIADIRIQNCLGVVYCDITGLKLINDTNGHLEGDQLIQRACESLRSVFGDYEIFRIGGDEFLIICQNIRKELLQEQAERLKTVAMQQEAVLAVGTSWSSDQAVDIQTLIVQAEKKMYEDKQLYYQTSGRDRRRR